MLGAGDRATESGIPFGGIFTSLSFAQTEGPGFGNTRQ
jgi:hypothetical protein